MKKIKREWKTLGSKLMYQNPWIKVYENKVINPEGKEGIFGYLNKASGVFVIAMDKDNSIFIIEEFRYPIKKSVLQLPAGVINNDNLLENAKRELKEETGIEAKSWVNLGDFYVAPGHETTRIYAFLATDLDISKIKISQEEDESILQIIKISIKDLKKKIVENKIKCGITLAALNLFFNYLENKSVIANE